MNPSFRRVDLSLCGPGVTRSDNMVVRVWTRRLRGEKSGGWRLLLETEVHMPSLQYLGKSVRASSPRQRLSLHLPQELTVPRSSSTPSPGPYPPTR